METLSDDGTPIGWTTVGSGPGLLVVHGAASDHSEWLPVAERLAPSLSVHLMDRRGRGASGDAASYALEREVEDVVAVAKATGATALLGHSFGAIIALEASLQLPGLALALYEPPIFDVADPPLPHDARYGAPAALQHIVDGDELVETFYRTIAGAGDEEVAALRADPSWHVSVAAAHTLPRETAATAAYTWEPSRFRPRACLLLQGSASPWFFGQGIAALHGVLGGRIATFDGQGHAAHMFAGDLFAGSVAAFLTEPRGLSTKRPPTA